MFKHIELFCFLIYFKNIRDSCVSDIGGYVQEIQKIECVLVKIYDFEIKKNSYYDISFSIDHSEANYIVNVGSDNQNGHAKEVNCIFDAFEIIYISCMLCAWVCGGSSKQREALHRMSSRAKRGLCE